MKVKESIVLLLVFFTLFAKGQIPELKSNTSGYDPNGSPLYKEFVGKYDFVISHHHMGGWSTEEFHYSILAFKGKKRYKIVYSLRKDFSDEPHHIPQIKKEEINKKTADSILSVFNANGFWDLDNTELNKEFGGKYYDVDAHKYLDRRVYTSDGFSDIFETISANSYRITSSYEPEFYFKELPELKQRGLFINAKRAFLSVFPTVWQPPINSAKTDK